MAQFSGTVLTKRGLQLQSKAQIGAKLEFTNVKLGEGTLAEGQSLEDLTGLVKPMLTLSIQSMEVIGDGTSRVRVVLSNQGLEKGFHVREIGVYAKDPQLGEILYSVVYAGEMADFLPAGGGIAVVEQILDLITIVGNAPNVTVAIDKHTMIATLEDLAEHNSSLSAHDGKINADTVDGKHSADFAAANILVPLTAGRWNKVISGLDRTSCDFYFFSDTGNNPLNVRGSLIGSNANSRLVLKYDTHSWELTNQLEIKIFDTGPTREVYFKPMCANNIILNPNYTFGIIHTTPEFDLKDDDTSGLNYVCKEVGSFINGQKVVTIDQFARGQEWTKNPDGTITQIIQRSVDVPANTVYFQTFNLPTVFPERCTAAFANISDITQMYSKVQSGVYQPWRSNSSIEVYLLSDTATTVIVEVSAIGY